MAASFLHGVETIDVEVGGQLIRTVRSAITIIVGVAPFGPTQSLVLCNNEADDAQFGGEVKTSSIGQSLTIIRTIAGSCPVVVINVFNRERDTVDLSGSFGVIRLVELGTCLLPLPPADNLIISDIATSQLIPGTRGVEWDVDRNGRFFDYTGAFESHSLKFEYVAFQPQVEASDLIGTVDAGGNRTGSKLMDLVYSTFGFTPKIIILPLYASLLGIAQAMRPLADRYRAMWLHDAPYGTTLAQALAGRGPLGTIGWNTPHARTILLFPHLLRYTETTNQAEPFPFSAFMAAAMIKNDLDNGFWWSPSNKEMTNVTGTTFPLTTNATDPSSDANTLNAAGVVCYYNGFGTGFRTWGNRTAAYLYSSSVKNFISVQRVADILAESIEQNALQYVDRTINNALIDVIKQDGNQYVASLIQRGALLPGSRLDYDPADNSSAELAAGNIKFRFVYMAPVPAERITFFSILDINLYRFVNQEAAQ